MVNFAVSLVLVILGADPVDPVGLEVTLQPHRRIVKVADPVYLKVTVANHADVPFKRSIFYLDGDTFSFRLTNRASGLSLERPNSLAVGQSSPSELKAGEGKQFYTWMYMPPLHKQNEPFWEPLMTGGELAVAGIYLITKSRLQQPSNAVEIILEERDGVESDALLKWHQKKIQFEKRRPDPSDFGLSLHGLGPSEVNAMLKEVAPGEVHDLLVLTLQLQELHEMADEDRQPANAELAAWLAEQVDIKRQCLVHRAHQLSQSYKMTSTELALEALLPKQE